MQSKKLWTIGVGAITALFLTGCGEKSTLGSVPEVQSGAAVKSIEGSEVQEVQIQVSAEEALEAGNALSQSVEEIMEEPVVEAPVESAPPARRSRAS